MRRQVGAVVLAVSVVGGIAAGVAVHTMTSDRSAASEAKPSVTSTPSTVAAAERSPLDPPGVEATDAVLVANTDGTATLSATLINHTKNVVFINEAYGAEERDPTNVLVYGLGSETALEPGVPMTIGGTADAYRIRTRDRAARGLSYEITLVFGGEGAVKFGAPPVTIAAKVAERTSVYADVADNGPNTAIEVIDGVVVVVPGQDKAYIGGWISTTISDQAYDVPTAVDSRGRSVAWMHQTASGGGFGIAAIRPRREAFTHPPYLDDGVSAEADYFLAKNVVVGDTIAATIRFPSGDVVAKFKVVQGNPDGTIAS